MVLGREVEDERREQTPIEVRTTQPDFAAGASLDEVLIHVRETAA
jgi:hypothetical protein